MNTKLLGGPGCITNWRGDEGGKIKENEISFN
jgi:hypothetical protein